MKIRLLTISNKAPSWITAGFSEYAKRLPSTCALELIEIPMEKRHHGADLAQIKEKEGNKLLSKIKTQNTIIAMDVKGKLWTTEQLSENISAWQKTGNNVDLLIGGPEGLSNACLKAAEITWSLSPLTFPHALVRIIIAEQIYRAWTILNNHPYHKF